jgi:hypothetical protein
VSGDDDSNQQEIAMIRRVMLAACVWLALVSPPVVAHEGHDHKILGTVTMAAADHLMLKDKTGKDVTVHITSATKVTRDKKPAAAAEIKAGMRVVVTAIIEKVNNAQRFRAKSIALGTVMPPK